MTILTKTAEHLLTELEAADAAFREGKRTEYKRAEREADERILALKIQRDRLAAEAREAGASFTRIASSLHTTATVTAREAVAAGRRLAPAVRAQTGAGGENDSRFAWDASAQTLTVTLAPVDVAPILEFTPFTLEDVNERPELLTQEFFRGEGDYWETAGTLTVGHPVAALFFSPADGSLLAEAEAFVGGLAA